MVVNKEKKKIVIKLSKREFEELKKEGRTITDIQLTDSTDKIDVFIILGSF